MQNKFQQELKAAFKAVEIEYECTSERYNAWQHLESLISQAVKRSEAECVLCLSNLQNYPPRPGEPNIFTYKKALEAVCLSMASNYEKYEDKGVGIPELKPDYWIDLAESEV